MKIHYKNNLKKHFQRELTVPPRKETFLGAMN